jgi:hypothetical protein
MLDSILGILGLAVAVFSIVDNRRQRNQREKAVIAAREVIQRVYGALIGLKPAIVAVQSDPDTSKAILLAMNDTLEAMNQQREILKSL